MAEELYVISEQDRLDIQEMKRKIDTLTRLPRYHNPEILEPTPEVYIGFTRQSGVTALTDQNTTGTGTTEYDDVPGNGVCDIFRIIGTGVSAQFLPIELNKTVYNLSKSTIPGWTWIPVVRDKFGYWLVVSYDSVRGGSAPFSGAKVSRQSSQSIPSASFGSETAISFDNQFYDEGGYWDPSQPTRFTIPSTGWYHIGGTAQFDPNFAYEHQRLVVWLNGIAALHDNDTISYPDTITGNCPLRSLELAIDFKLTGGNYIQLRVGQVNSGAANRDVISGDCQFWIHKLG